MLTILFKVVFYAILIIIMAVMTMCFGTLCYHIYRYERYGDPRSKEFLQNWSDPDRKPEVKTDIDM